jgi:hypothetical protein
LLDDTIDKDEDEKPHSESHRRGLPIEPMRTETLHPCQRHRVTLTDNAGHSADWIRKCLARTGNVQLIDDRASGMPSIGAKDKKAYQAKPQDVI